jgi:acyl dehydratase
MGHGGITTGLLHALIATDLPGPGSVFARQQWSFPRPVYIGDTIRATATVTRANERRHFAELAIEVRNQNGEVVLEGEASVFQARP